MASSRVVEITIISCEDLTTTSFKKPIRKNARGVIRMPHCNEVCSTSLDKKGGSFPRWNEKFTMEMPSWANWFDVEIYSGMEKVKRTKEREEGFGRGYVVGVPSRMVTGIPVYSGGKM
ncbi:unnamed protein product [Rhodiola kirilowii]